MLTAFMQVQRVGIDVLHTRLRTITTALVLHWTVYKRARIKGFGPTLMGVIASGIAARGARVTTVVVGSNPTHTHHKKLLGGNRDN